MVVYESVGKVRQLVGMREIVRGLRSATVALMQNALCCSQIRWNTRQNSTLESCLRDLYSRISVDG